MFVARQSGLLVPEFDAIGAGAGGPSGDLSYSHTIGGDCFVAWVSMQIVGTPAAGTLKVGGSGGTAATNFGWWLITQAGYNFYLGGFYLLAPPTGAQTILYQNGARAACGVSSVSYKGVGSVGSVVQTSAANASISQSVSSSDEKTLYCFGVMAALNGTITAFNQATRSNVTGVSNVNNAMLVGDAPGNGGTLPFTATATGALGWNSAYLPLIAA